MGKAVFSNKKSSVYNLNNNNIHIANKGALAIDKRLRYISKK